MWRARPCVGVPRASQLSLGDLPATLPLTQLEVICGFSKHSQEDRYDSHPLCALGNAQKHSETRAGKG